VQQLLTKVYGTVRETGADKKAEIEKYRKIYAAGYSQPGDGGRGRVLFNKVCAQCHTLFDVGGKVGPDITGANRADLNYLLETIVDPNAVIPNEYRRAKSRRRMTQPQRHREGDGDKTVLFQSPTSCRPRARGHRQQRQTELSMMPGCSRR
jgi:putative heme-binding domain-containing protein